MFCGRFLHDWVPVCGDGGGCTSGPTMGGSGELRPKARVAVRVGPRQTGNVYKKVNKKIKKEVAFPTCISVNNEVCHFSPLDSDETVLEVDGYFFGWCSDMACHIYGFISAVAHTHVLQEGPITRRATDVIAAAIVTSFYSSCMFLMG
ncbi:hypothetical protein V8G54_009355 [Vigna mungo]|uniref:Uncharacterized protein n=1 Tax=Vigna mungo TaxID=3915 RepID=A0AAQ3NXW7_VIGMU